MDSIIHEKPFVLPFKFVNFNNLSILLNVIENFDCKFKGEKWEPLKREIYEKFLLKKASALAKSRNWAKRNFAAGCFSLCPSEKNLALILHLMNDPVFLVRGIVSATENCLKIVETLYKKLAVKLFPAQPRQSQNLQNCFRILFAWLILALSMN